MQATMTTDLESVLERQIGELERLARAETDLQRAVTDRDWQAAEALIDELRKTAEGFSQLESARHDAYRALLDSVGARRDMPFPVALGRLDEDSRRTLTDLYRRLKVALFRVRSISEGLDAFVATLMTTTRGILEELYPTRKGRMYGPRGTVSGTEDWALIVNTNL